MLKSQLLTALGVLGCAGLIAAAAAPTETFHLDGASRVVVNVGKAGLLGFVGHAHTVEAPVTGRVFVDRQDPAASRVELEFDSASLRVVAEGEPAGDVPEVQRVMLSAQVLDAARYPKITFRSRRVAPAASSGSGLNFSVEGDLSLHGVTRQCVVPVRVTIGDATLVADGRTTIRQSDFGIEPVTAGGGAVRVKDALTITFSIRATR